VKLSAIVDEFARKALGAGKRWVSVEPWKRYRPSGGLVLSD
jgi:hypothetical protein